MEPVRDPAAGGRYPASAGRFQEKEPQSTGIYDLYLRINVIIIVYFKDISRMLEFISDKYFVKRNNYK
jgi:hypothetical protein